MTASLIVLGVALVGAIGVLGYVALRSRLGPAPSLVSKTVVVHTRDGKSLRGLLFAQHADRVTLREAVFLHGADEQPIGGLAHVPVASVSWLQEIVPEKDE